MINSLPNPQYDKKEKNMYPGKIELITREHGQTPVSFTALQSSPDDDSIRYLQAVGPFGSIDVQYIKNPNYDISLGTCQFLQNTRVQVLRCQEHILLQFGLKGNFEFSTPGSPDAYLLEQHYIIAYAPNKLFEYRFKKNEVYSVFNIAFTPTFFREWCAPSPQFSEFSEKMAGGNSAYFNTAFHYATPEMMTIIWEIRHCTPKNTLQKIYLESKMLNLLMLSLQNMHNHEPQKNRLRPTDIEKIQNARSYLIAHMSDPCSLEELAYRMGTNDFKLKNGFRQIFGTTVFGLLYEERMQKARTLLLQTDLQIKKIAISVGYKSLSNFTEAFKKKFGYPPSTLRRKTSM